MAKASHRSQSAHASRPVPKAPVRYAPDPVDMPRVLGWGWIASGIFCALACACCFGFPKTAAIFAVTMTGALLAGAGLFALIAYFVYVSRYIADIWVPAMALLDLGLGIFIIVGSILFGVLSTFSIAVIMAVVGVAHLAMGLFERPLTPHWPPFVIGGLACIAAGALLFLQPTYATYLVGAYCAVRALMLLWFGFLYRKVYR